MDQVVNHLWMLRKQFMRTLSVILMCPHNNDVRCLAWLMSVDFGHDRQCAPPIDRTPESNVLVCIIMYMSLKDLY